MVLAAVRFRASSRREGPPHCGPLTDYLYRPSLTKARGCRDFLPLFGDRGGVSLDFSPQRHSAAEPQSIKNDSPQRHRGHREESFDRFRKRHPLLLGSLGILVRGTRFSRLVVPRGSPCFPGRELGLIPSDSLPAAMRPTIRGRIGRLCGLCASVVNDFCHPAWVPMSSSGSGDGSRPDRGGSMVGRRSVPRPAEPKGRGEGPRARPARAGPSAPDPDRSPPACSGSRSRPETGGRTQGDSWSSTRRSRAG
jgi:hypothetical protein